MQFGGSATEDVDYDRPIRVVIADDHAVVRTALARTLDVEPDIDVIGEATDGGEAIKLAEELTPDVVVMDVCMAPISGTEATRCLRTSRPTVRVIGLSMHDAEWMGRSMLQAGACAYVEKGEPLTKLIAEVRSAAEEQPVLT